MTCYDFTALRMMLANGGPYQKHDHGGLLCYDSVNPPHDWHMRGTIDLLLRKGYLAAQEDGTVIVTERGRARLARWEATMAEADKKVEANNAAQRLRSLERKLARAQAEMLRLQRELRAASSAAVPEGEINA